MKKRSAKLRIPGLSPTDEGYPDGSYVLVIEGGEASGKDHLAFDAPGPFGFFGIDLGAKRAVRRARKEGKEVHLHHMEFDVPRFIPKQERDFWVERAKVVKKSIFDPYLEAWEAVTEEEGIRTIIQDTATDIWELHQAAEFGKLQQNQQLAYGPLKSEYMSMVKRAKRKGKLVILLHQIADEYKDVFDQNGNKKSEKTGKMRRLGMNKVHYIMDAAVRTLRIEPEVKVRKGVSTVTREGGWAVQIIQAKNRPELNGTVLDNPSFSDLMMELEPETDPSYWIE